MVHIPVKSYSGAGGTRAAEPGYYLHPEAIGQPATKGVNHSHQR